MSPARLGAAAGAAATPNHWHALPTVWALRAGKDVYVEKPVSHSVGEGVRMVEETQSAGRTAVDTTPCHHPPRLALQPAEANTNLVTLHGARGRSCTLENSADLTTWTNLFDLPGTNGLWEIPLAVTNAPRQFLRAKVLP